MAVVLAPPDATLSLLLLVLELFVTILLGLDFMICRYSFVKYQRGRVGTGSMAKTDFYTKWHVYADFYTRIIIENSPLLQKSAYRSQT